LEKEDFGKIGILRKAFEEAVRDGLSAIPLTQVHVALNGGLAGACAEGGTGGLGRLEKGGSKNDGIPVAGALEKRPEPEPVELLQFVPGLIVIPEGMAEFRELPLPVGIPDGAAHGLTRPNLSVAGRSEGLPEAGEAGSESGPVLKPGGCDGGALGIVLLEELAGKGGGEKGTPEIEEDGGVARSFGAEVIEGGGGIPGGELDKGKCGGGEEVPGGRKMTGLPDKEELLPRGGKVLFGEGLVGHDPADQGGLGQIGMVLEEGRSVAGGHFPISKGLVNAGQLEADKGTEAFGTGIFDQPTLKEAGRFLKRAGLHGGKSPEADPNLVEFRFRDLGLAAVPLVKCPEGGEGVCGIPPGERPAGGLPLFPERHDGNERERKEGEQDAAAGAERNPHDKRRMGPRGRAGKGPG